MTTLFLTRHAETIWHAENRYTGSSDIGLTANGRAQAEALGGWSVDAGLDEIVSSTLVRSIDTATPAARRCGLALTTDARLAEVDFGRGEGLTRAEMAERFPDALAAFLAAPGTTPLPGGEPGTAALARALPALRALCSAHPEGRVLVVMHSTLLRLVLCRLTGIDVDRYRSVFPAVVNCALTAFDVPPAASPDAPLIEAALLSFNVPPA